MRGSRIPQSLVSPVEPREDEDREFSEYKTQSPIPPEHASEFEAGNTA